MTLSSAGWGQSRGPWLVGLLSAMLGWLGLVLVPSPSWAQSVRSGLLSSREQVAKVFSSPGVLGTAAGLGLADLYLFRGGQAQDQLGDRLLLAAAAALLITEGGVKRFIKEERPDGSDRESFPSGHTAMAFAVAEVLARHHRDQREWYYAAAGLVGWSRVELRKHYWHDVLAGAALGVAVARLVGDDPFHRRRWEPAGAKGRGRASRVAGDRLQGKVATVGGRDLRVALGLSSAGGGIAMVRLQF